MIVEEAIASGTPGPAIFAARRSQSDIATVMPARQVNLLDTLIGLLACGRKVDAGAQH
jgi:hypothetical protein